VIRRSLAAAGRAHAFHALSAALIGVLGAYLLLRTLWPAGPAPSSVMRMPRSQLGWSLVHLPLSFSRTLWLEASWQWAWRWWEECWPV
jgi:hypothetical protein